MGDMGKTEQEKFWAGEFGTEYSDRNVGANILASNIALFADIFKRTPKLNSVVEFGSNIGLNLRALDLLYPGQNRSQLKSTKLPRRKLTTHCRIRKCLT